MQPQDVEQFKGVCENLEVLQEGGAEYVFLKRLKIRVGADNHVVDALLSLGPHTGYSTRLFLSQPFPAKAGNWTTHQILGRSWHTWSWQGVPADLPPMQILLCHLDALK
jgi:hypothetical protein